MAATLELGGKEGINDSLGNIGRRGFLSEAENVGVIVLPGQRCHFLREDEGGPNAGDFVRRDAHAHARRADQQAETALGAGNALGHGLGEIRVIGRFGRIRAQIGDVKTLLEQVLLEGLFETESRMVGTDGELQLGDVRSRVMKVGRSVP